ncbi:hypothetical protein A3193_03655 [Candidatus Thiodiazotropha endoloripes]|uniref:DUF4007 family protein n=1 Tax=Candidatus Thiodiazotropha endoloripes TaxID=1818881 RepID=UPI00083D19D7|nr:DUF4007 family protein [Candidatus Thiodiazotropha endoloripes]ODB88000.1 hypothetical protein A3193_03655 [Candidatus Thiodiazotropha endoloripes]
MTVYFHGSFGLNRSNFVAVLQAALQNPSWDDTELAKPLGYGKPFAQKYRSWLHKVGLIEQGMPVKLTPKGAAVWSHDPGLNSSVSLWFLHHELTTDPERAEAWHYFAHNFLPKHPTFTSRELLDGLTGKLRSHSEQHFGPGSQLNKVICRKILDAYTQRSGLGELNLISKNNNLFVRGEPRTLGPWKSVSAIAKAYQ